MVQNAKSTNLNTYLDVYSFKGKNLHEWYKSKKSWPVNSNASTREKAEEISKSRIPNFPNFLWLVLGCIEAKFCK